MADSATYDPRTGKLLEKTVTGEKKEGMEEAATRGKFGSTAGRNLGALEKGGAGAPKQKEGESIQEFAARRRKYQEEQASGQKKAFAPASK